jgi:hypothetical protein
VPRPPIPLNRRRVTSPDVLTSWARPQLRSYLRELSPETVRVEIGSGAEDLVQMLHKRSCVSMSSAARRNHPGPRNARAGQATQPTGRGFETPSARWEGPEAMDEP